MSTISTLGSRHADPHKSKGVLPQGAVMSDPFKESVRDSQECGVPVR